MFDKCYTVSARPFTQWESEAKRRPDKRWGSLVSDPREILPDAKCILVPVKAYKPYTSFPKGSITLDAYYPASQEAYLEAKQYTEQLKSDGFQAVLTPMLPAKAALLRSGEAHYGRSGLLDLPDIGTFFCIQTIVCDAPFEALDAPVPELSQHCDICNACMLSCPAGALPGDTSVQTARCLRAQSYTELIPPEIRPLLGLSLLGCNTCQLSCPRNKGIESVPVPKTVSDALRFDELLAGHIKPLAALIGPNYARTQRIQARAALLAGNSGRRELIPILRELSESTSSELIKIYAEWSIERLQCL